MFNYNQFAEDMGIHIIRIHEVQNFCKSVEKFSKEELLEELEYQRRKIVEDWCRDPTGDHSGFRNTWAYGEKKYDKKVIKYLGSLDSDKQHVDLKKIPTRKERNRIKLAIKYMEIEFHKYYEMYNKYADLKNSILVFARIGDTAWVDKKYRWYNFICKSWFLDGMCWPYDHSYAVIFIKVDNPDKYEIKELDKKDIITGEA